MANAVLGRDVPVTVATALRAHVNARIAQDLKSMLVKEAQRQDRSESYIISQALLQYLSPKPKHAERMTQ